MHIKSFYILVPAAMAIALASCGIEHPYQRPALPADSLFRNSTVPDTNTLAALGWRELFTDPGLRYLIAEGIAHNPDLQAAYAHVQQAQALFFQGRAALVPTLGANAGLTHYRYPKSQSSLLNNATQFQLGLSAAWEADIWGKLRSNRRAGFAAWLQARAAARAVQTGLVSAIANDYFLLLALDRQLAITRQTVQNWDTTVITMRVLKESARVTEAAVVQSEAQREAAAVTIPDLEQNIRVTENALNIMLGRAPSGIARSSLEDQPIPAALRTGVPAQLLANRPDVMEAEENFRYRFELTNAARAYFYPSLTITGSSGLNALSFADLFRPGSLAASIGAGLAAPILNQRANRTRLDVARAQQQEALLNFRSTLLNAGREVSDALSSYAAAGEKTVIRSRQIIALRRSVDYTAELLRNGFANYTEIITARQSLLQAELGRVNDHLQQLQAVVNLYRSLGGGWK